MSDLQRLVQSRRNIRSQVTRLFNIKGSFETLSSQAKHIQREKLKKYRLVNIIKF